MTYSSTRRLRRLFETLTATGVAITATGCQDLGGYPADTFDLDACSDGELDVSVGLSPEFPVDAILGRTLRGDGGTPAFAVATGTACATATDAEACRHAVAVLPDSGYVLATFEDDFDRTSVLHQVAFTDGDTVELLDSTDEYLAFVGSIDTPQEAYAVVKLEAPVRQELCGRANVREAPGGYEVVFRYGTSCDENGVEEWLFRVTRSGGIERIGRRQVVRHEECGGYGRLTEGVSLRSSTASSIGEHLAWMAALEAAAVHAFDRLADEMVALGAPAELVARARRSARDEARHVGMVGAQAARFGATPVQLEVDPAKVRTRLAIALENAQEGMVRETYGALVAHHHARHAQDAELARMFRALAVDETRHAALSIDFGRWLESTLSDDERRTVEAARRVALAQLADDVGAEIDAESARLLGWPSGETARALIAKAFPAVWDGSEASA